MVMNLIDLFGKQLKEWTDYALQFMSTKDVVIPHMEWEVAAAAALDISFSEMRFVLSLILAIPLSFVVRAIKNRSARYVYSTACGLILIIYPFGRGVLQITFPSVTTYLAMLLIPKRCGTIAWLTVFPYLVWLQIVTASGMACNTGGVDFVGGIMVLTLKLISMASSRQDSFSKKPLTQYQAAHKIDRMPGPLSFFSFVFAQSNLLVGPTIEYAEYEAFMRLEGVWSTGSGKLGAPLGLSNAFSLIAQGLGFMGLHIVLISKLGWGIHGSFWFKDPAYTRLPLLVRLGSQVVCGFAHQVKYYFLWKLSESASILSGFDYEGVGDEGVPRWGRCTNVRFLGMWLADSSRIVPQHWNIRTGIFLRHYVYERLVGHSGKASFIHVLITQLITAFWHGVYPGYIIFFVGIRKSWPWWLFKVAWTDIAVCYMAMAFVILDGKKSLEVHADVAFLPHIIMIGICALSPLVPRIKRASKDKTQ
ncbi:hypothetical protein CEUSTIGMA_g6249.t1 [Chlamydomonas eustigma]|uniref:Uncharacterized protein n=1 Tax=Chlamydomonas eustigma TaxID=1157962 RepID=A0A250X7E7_9CHLO|nr:hypothetical protein CEUSTIGMA_g6249.t1 [Chlamydomonas eustigma]|eukprot:GAX78812.1 hypothetical protein CEUSTIGMA_g6249.t1 [Chlamydomonas eustigma]